MALFLYSFQCGPDTLHGVVRVVEELAAYSQADRQVLDSKIKSLLGCFPHQGRARQLSF